MAEGGDVGEVFRRKSEHEAGDKDEEGAALDPEATRGERRKRREAGGRYKSVTSAARGGGVGEREASEKLLPSPSSQSCPGNLASIQHTSQPSRTGPAVVGVDEADIIREDGLKVVQSTVAEMDEEDALLTQCGIGRHRPTCLQRFATKNWMLFWLCWFCTVQGMLVNGLVPSVLSTIERRFSFTTSMVGRIMQFYDIGYVLCCIPVSYFGGRHSQPLFLGLGLLIMGCGSFLFAMPHIVSETYSRTSQSIDMGSCTSEAKSLHDKLHPPFHYNSSSNCNSADEATQASDRIWYLFVFCLAHFLHGVGATPLFTLGVSYIDENVKPTLSSVYIGVFYAFAIFGPAAGFLMSGSFLRYHTDFFQEESDMKITEVDETDPHWVGAWWIGFLLASIISVLAVFPILSFPKVLPGAIQWHKSRLRKGSGDRRVQPTTDGEGEGPTDSGMDGATSPNSIALNQTSVIRHSHNDQQVAIVHSQNSHSSSQPAPAPLPPSHPYVPPASHLPPPATQSASLPMSAAETERDKKSAFWRGVRDDILYIPRAVKRLLSNLGYLFITLAAAVDGLLITGLSAFMAKYLERQFNIRSSRSNMLIGCIMVPVAGVGTVASGYIVKRFRLTCHNTLKFCIVMVVFSLVLSPMFLVYCDHSPLVGVETDYPNPNTPYSTSHRSMNGSRSAKFDPESGCNAHCHCRREDYHPVCSQSDKDNPIDLSFYSPCYAGCPEPYEPLKQYYSNCTCPPNKQLKKGLCESKCSGLFGFLVLFAPMCLCTFSVGVPALSVVLRCVDYKERSFALGIQWILIRLIGTIPAPVLFGWLFDSSCVHRYVDPCTQIEGTCYVYNNKLLADLFLAFALVGQTGTLLFFVLSLIFYRRDPSREDPMKVDIPL